MKIERALLSVTDKTGIVELARALTSLGVEIISTGGAYRILKDASIAPLREVASVTRIASPSPPPIWREVFTRPDASPACPSLAPCVAAIVEGTIDIAIPAAVSSPGSMM